MQILNFIRSLLPRLSKNDILEDLRITKGELESTVIPIYKQAVEYFNKNKARSIEVSDLSSVFYNNYKLKTSSKEMIVEIHDKLPLVSDMVEYIDHQLEELLEHDIIKEGLTAKKAVLIRAAEYLSFFAKYSIDLVNYVYTKEIQDKSKNTEITVSKVQEDFIIKNMTNYARVLSVVGIAKKDMEKHLEQMPDVVINDSTEKAVVGVYNENKIDPFGSSLILGFQGSPIYHFRLMIAEWQANRYKSMKDKKRMLELKLMNLKMQQESSNADPKLEKEIAYIEERIETYEYKMHKMEESVQ